MNMDGGEDVEDGKGVVAVVGYVLVRIIMVMGGEVWRGSDSGSGETDNGRELHMGGDGRSRDGCEGVESGEDGSGGVGSDGGRRTEVFDDRECCGGREIFVDSDCGNTEDGYGDGGGEGCKEGEMQESGGIQ